jgi:hypothetical protein
MKRNEFKYFFMCRFVKVSGIEWLVLINRCVVYLVKILNRWVLWQVQGCVSANCFNNLWYHYFTMLDPYASEMTAPHRTTSTRERRADVEQAKWWNLQGTTVCLSVCSDVCITIGFATVMLHLQEMSIKANRICKIATNPCTPLDYNFQFMFIVVVRVNRQCLSTQEGLCVPPR